MAVRYTVNSAQNPHETETATCIRPKGPATYKLQAGWYQGPCVFQSILAAK